MNTRPIPSIVMLLAGFVTCVYGFINHMENMRFIWTLLAVMIVFYIIGSIVKIVLDRNFKAMGKEESSTEEEKSDGEKPHVEDGSREEDTVQP